SSTKFNISKTQIIPVGSPTYRKSVIETRKISAEQPALPEHINIAPDGTATRILGAWLGNLVNQVSVWTPTMEKITKRLNHWRKSFPTLEGKVKIIQMTVASMTQYLASVQGMPRDVQTQLEKVTRNFLWGENKRTPLNGEIL
ncbi:hypothetical protein B0H19DRAFT_845166, partial [Mycena capillaripes]